MDRWISRAGSCRISAQRLSFGRKSLLALFRVILACLTKDVLAFVPGPYRPRSTTRRSIPTYSKRWFVMEWLLHNHVVYEDGKFTVQSLDNTLVANINWRLFCLNSFFKGNVRYPVYTCRDPISLILETRFYLILGTRWQFSLVLATRIGSSKCLKKPWFKWYCFSTLCPRF